MIMQQHWLTMQLLALMAALLAASGGTWVCLQRLEQKELQLRVSVLTARE
jgi:hypothetical protein